MKEGSVLVRETDGKRFRVRLLSHWSDLVAEDGETASVKWAFDNRYAGVRGPMFMLLAEEA